MSYVGRVHTVQIGDLTRELPLFNVAPNVTIAIFNMLGDTAVVEEAADLLAARMPADADVLVVPEVKAIPLGHALAVRTDLPLAVVRKFRKPYMADCLESEVVSITTGVPQQLYVDGKDLQALHLFAEKDGRVLAYCRLLAPGAKYAEASIGRVVSAPEVRGTGAGRELMRQALEHCQQHYPDSGIRISAQCYLQRFYESFGFGSVGEPYDEDGIPHIEMLCPGTAGAIR